LNILVGTPTPTDSDSNPDEFEKDIKPQGSVIWIDRGAGKTLLLHEFVIGYECMVVEYGLGFLLVGVLGF
jgi:hypothetical protein